jgi:hypothetical protein
MTQSIAVPSPALVHLTVDVGFSFRHVKRGKIPPSDTLRHAGEMNPPTQTKVSDIELNYSS